jgi:hypothetical protein
MRWIALVFVAGLVLAAAGAGIRVATTKATANIGGSRYGSPVGGSYFVLQPVD